MLQQLDIAFDWFLMKLLYVVTPEYRSSSRRREFLRFLVECNVERYRHADSLLTNVNT